MNNPDDEPRPTMTLLCPPGNAATAKPDGTHPTHNPPHPAGYANKPATSPKPGPAAAGPKHGAATAPTNPSADTWIHDHDQAGYHWHSYCTPTRQDLWPQPIHQPTLGTAGATLLTITAIIYAITTIALTWATP